jgi:mRNA-degrading endonuclease toxin of MazEF toxin-antitoxin module
MVWPETLPVRRGEVWWVEFDPSIGSEIRKTRPAVIVSNDVANHAAFGTAKMTRCDGSLVACVPIL